MSMLSAQCDELRAMAESVGLEVPQAATLMMGAADAIDRLDAENAKLRELVLDMLRWMPCPAPCGRCERYRYPEGCEFEIRRRELGVEL